MSTVQGGSPNADKPPEVDSIQVEIDRIHAMQQRKLKTTGRILAVIALAVIIVIGFAVYNVIDELTKSVGDSDKLAVELDCVNGTSNWTLIITSSNRQFDLRTVKANLFNESGIVQSPLSDVALSSLTAANWINYHVRYEKVNNETVVLDGARMVIDKAAYPRAYWFALVYQSQIIGQMVLR